MMAGRNGYSFVSVEGFTSGEGVFIVSGLAIVYREYFHSGCHSLSGSGQPSNGRLSCQLNSSVDGKC